MAEDKVQYNHHEKKSDEPSAAVAAADRGPFDFMGKKEEEWTKCEGEVIATEFDEKVKVSHDEKKEEHMEKLQRSNSSSSSSSEEEGEGGEKKKKNKGLKEKMTEKLSGEKGEEKDTNIPIEKCDDDEKDTEEKKGFLDKIKEKLPGGKKAEEVASPPPTPAPAAECATSLGTAEKEKKGFLDKIKDKIPGYSKNGEEKEKEKDGVCN